MLSLTRGQAVVWPKFSASGCEISLNVPLTPGLAIILEKLGKSETRERQIFERNEVYHGRSNFRNVSNFSHENDLCKPAFNNIKVFSFEFSRTSHNVPCFHFTGEIGGACFAQTLGLVKFSATAFQRIQQQHPFHLRFHIFSTSYLLYVSFISIHLGVRVSLCFDSLMCP